MTEKSYLIELFDITTQKKSIIQTEPFLLNESPNYFNQVLEKLNKKFVDTNNITETVNNQILQLNISMDKMYAQIYVTQENVERGWIWNSTNSSKNILFELTLIELDNQFFEYNHHSNCDFGYGYAKNCFAPDWKSSFIDELNYKLLLPNYGLNKINTLL